MAVSKQPRQGGMEAALTRLTINSDLPSSSSAKKKSTSSSASASKATMDAPESWDDETSDQDQNQKENASGDETPTSPDAAQVRRPAPEAPPPTPSTPSGHATWDNPHITASLQSSISSNSANEPLTPLRGHFRPGGSSQSSSSRSDTGVSPASTPTPPSERPDKSSAVAARMIAGALGVRRPKETEESRAYERAVREREGKRRERQRAEQRQAETAKEEARRAVWED